MFWEQREIEAPHPASDGSPERPSCSTRSHCFHSEADEGRVKRIG